MFKSYLKNSKKKSTVLLKSWYHKAERLPLVFSTGIIGEPKEWDNQARRFKEGKRHPMGRTNNGLIDRYKTEAEQYIKQRQALELRTPDHLEVKTFLRNLKDKINGITTTAEGKRTDIIQTVMEFYQTVKQDPKRSQHYAKGFLTLHRNLTQYKKEKNAPINFHSINPKWFAAWQKWNFETNHLSQNALAGYWKRLKTVCIYAKEQGLFDIEPWKDKRLAINFQRADEVWLTPAELMKLYHLDLSQSHLETDRDLFLLDALNSGHRLSDMANVNHSNILEIDKAKIIKIHAHKTDTLVYSPNGWYIQEFLQKYDNSFPAMKAEQVFNRNIREVCRLAGIDRPTKLRKNRAGKNIYITKPKWQWVHQYTARYSFATNLSLAGASIQDISRLMGHTTIKQTEGYIKSKQLHAAINAAQNPYFMEKPEKKTG